MDWHSMILSIVAILVPILALVTYLLQIKKLRLEIRQSQEKSKPQSPVIVYPTLHEILEYGGKIREPDFTTKKEKLHAFPFTLFYGWPSSRLVFPLLANSILDDVIIHRLKAFDHGLRISSWLLVVALFLLARYHLKNIWTAFDYLEQLGVFLIIVFLVDFFLSKAFKLDKSIDIKEQSLNTNG